MLKGARRCGLGKFATLGVVLGLSLACQGGESGSNTQGASQVERQSASDKQMRIFYDAAAHIVGAFEHLKKLDSHYDETGACGPHCSIWQFTTKNPSVRYHLTRFESMVAPGAAGPDVGRYSGYAELTLVSPPQKKVRIDLNLIYSGEDYTVDVKIQSP